MASPRSWVDVGEDVAVPRSTGSRRAAGWIDARFAKSRNALRTVSFVDGSPAFGPMFDSGDVVRGPRLDVFSAQIQEAIWLRHRKLLATAGISRRDLLDHRRWDSAGEGDRDHLAVRSENCGRPCFGRAFFLVTEVEDVTLAMQEQG